MQTGKRASSQEVPGKRCESGVSDPWHW